MPERWIRLAMSEGCIVPAWLTGEDHAWLRAFLVELHRLEGATLEEFRKAFEGTIMPACIAWNAPPRAVRGLGSLIPSVWMPAIVSAARPSEIRQILFEAAASGLSRDEAIRRTADVLQIDPSEVLPGAYADRSGERKLAAPEGPISPAWMARHYNQALARSLLLRSSELSLRIAGADASLARAAKMLRLECAWTQDEHGGKVIVTGPLALVHHTTRYGHALVRFLGELRKAGPWTCTARCCLKESQTPLPVNVSHSDPIGASAMPSCRPKATPENQVLRAFRSMPGGWIAVRESEALRVGSDVFFPDIKVVRGDEEVRLEWVGFHTSAHLQRRLGRLRSAGVGAYVLCADEAMCSGAIHDGPSILRYRGKVPIPALLETIERVAGETRSAA